MALEIIDKEFNSYFSVRNIALEILAKKYNYSQKGLLKDPKIKKEYNSIVKQLIHIVQDLKKEGKIKPYSRAKYKKVKVI